MQAEVVTSVARLEEYESGWDALAVACRRPRAAPAWTLAWFRHGLPADALIRTVIISDGTVVVGTAPFFVTRTGAGFYRYSPAAPILNGVVPLAWPGREEEVGEAIGAALARGAAHARSRVDRMDAGCVGCARSDTAGLAQTAARVDRRTSVSRPARRAGGAGLRCMDRGSIEELSQFRTVGPTQARCTGFRAPHVERTC